MTSKIITALITVLLVMLSGCGPAANTISPPAKTAPANKPNTKKCTPGYHPCLPPRAHYDCSDIKGRVFVSGDDPYRLDRDYDGVGCDVDDQ